MVQENSGELREFRTDIKHMLDQQKTHAKQLKDDVEEIGHDVKAIRDYLLTNPEK